VAAVARVVIPAAINALPGIKSAVRGKDGAPYLSHAPIDQQRPIEGFTAEDEKFLRATVWRALSAQLDRMSIRHNKSRVGRWGPDLITNEAPDILFEIKCDIQASDIAAGIGPASPLRTDVEEGHRNPRPNTLTQDRISQRRPKPLASHGRTIHRVNRIILAPGRSLRVYPDKQTFWVCFGMS
jgi:hypothetical protein